MSLAPGARLGRYLIDDRVGAGGMGEVYRARDTRLNRTVAIKVLPAHLSADPEGCLRFEREARTLATLSHPHICPIYDVGREADRDYLVMEFLDGESLARRIARGPVPMAEVIRCGAGIASALAAAHAHGIVHRDLKPGNVMLTSAGVKLLDFGIARVHTVATAATSSPLTAEGTVVGTYEYMAPEQIQGSVVDARADLFAFGAVLFELITARPAFARATPAATAAAVLTEDLPSPSSVRAETPATLDRLVARCLEKDANARWASAHDAALVLRDLRERTTDAVPMVAKRGGSRLPWIVAALGAGSALALVALLLRPAQPSPVHRLSVLPPAGTTFALEEAPQISPDGSRLMFVTLDDRGINRLYIRPLDSLDAEVVGGSEGATLPFWAPDSRGFAFFGSDGWLKVVEGGAGAPRNLARAAPPRGATWTETDEILFVPFPALPVHRVSVRGGTPEPLPLPHREALFRWFPQSLPGTAGRRYLFHFYASAAVQSGSRIAVADVESGAPTTVIEGAFAGVYAPNGHLLYPRQDRLAAVTFDVDTLKVGRTPAALPVHVSQNPVTTQPPFSVSSTGVLAYFEATPTSQITRVDRAGTRLADIGAPATYSSLCVSRNGAQVVADGTDSKGLNLDIWRPGSDGALSRLTFHDAIDFYPVCSADGREVVFASLRNGPPDLYRISLSAPGTEQIFLDTPGAKLPLDWSRDGHWILYSAVTPQGEWDVWAMAADTSREPFPVLQVPRDQRDARLSPDGRWLAYSSNESGRFEVYVQPFAPAGQRAQAPRWQVSRGGGSEVHWRGDGLELFYLSGSNALTAVGVRAKGDTFEVGSATELFYPRLASFERFTRSQYAVAPDGQTFLVNRPSDAAAARTVTVILNWPGLLTR